MALQNKTVGVLVAGAAATAAAAAGAYWLYGSKHAAKNRRLAKSWMLRARAEVMDAVEKAKNLDREGYLRIVDQVAKGYATVAGSASPEFKRLVADLRDSWRYISQQKAHRAKHARSRKTRNIVSRKK